MTGTRLEAGRAFDVARFAELRRARGVGWGAPLVYTSETGSTNDDALAAARAQGAASADGSVFLADHQTAGRGRRGKTWLAAPGRHLLFSILLRDLGARCMDESARAAERAAHVPLGRASRGDAGPGVGALTLAVGLGVRAALATRSAVSLGVKWPNDVLAAPAQPARLRGARAAFGSPGPRKLAGILCEGQFVGSRLDAIVVGIGINVLEGSYPAELEGQVACLEELASGRAAHEANSPDAGSGHVITSDTAIRDSAPRDSATSVSRVIGSSIEREDVLVDVLAAVESRVRRYLESGFGALLDEFTQHDALAGERVEVSGASPVVGTARGVDAAGRLLVESDGLLVPVISGTVRRLER